MLSKKIFLAATFVVAAFLTGCASVPLADNQETVQAKSFQPPEEGQSGLYIYRDSFVGQALKKNIWVDGNCIGETSNKVFFYVTVDGDKEHRISTESEFSPNDLTLFTQSGKNYFIRQYIKMGAFVGGAGLELVSEEDGMAAVSTLNMAVQGTCTNKAPNP